MAASLVLLTGQVGCSNKISDRDIVWVEPDDASRALTRRSGAFGLGQRGDSMWLDPRTPESFATGHIPGAMNIPFRELETLYPTIRDRGTIIVYGSGPDDPIAAAASKRLLELGHSNVLTLRGGLRSWERAGNEVSKN